jgi:hypothetical protein
MHRTLRCGCRRPQALAHFSSLRASPTPPLRHDLSTDLDLPLAQRERRLFDLLISITDTYQLGTTLRVAGGWVRNKLLGSEAGDIDIALDNLTGREFTEHVQRFLVQQVLSLQLIWRLVFCSQHLC